MFWCQWIHLSCYKKCSWYYNQWIDLSCYKKHSCFDVSESTSAVTKSIRVLMSVNRPQLSQKAFVFWSQRISKMYHYIVSPTRVSATSCVCRVTQQCNSNLLPHFCTGILSLCELTETGCASITIGSHFWLNKLVSSQLILVWKCDEVVKTQKHRHFPPRNQVLKV